MIVPAAIRLRFQEIEPELDGVAAEVRQTISNFCDRHGFAYAGRKKTLESLAEKIETGRYEKWSELDDLFGCVIVIPTLDHEIHVLDFLRNAFREVTIKTRGSTRKSPEVFRFDATRFIGRLEQIQYTEPQTSRTSICFEVQIRSAFEHAWSVTTHALYKGKSLNWKTKRLVHQIKAAVEQLDTLVLALEASAGPIIEHDWPELSLQCAIIRRFSELVELGRIPEVLAPKDWTRFAENIFSMIRAGVSGNRSGMSSVQRLADETVNCVTEQLPSDPLLIPHSISLLQYVLGVATSREVLQPPFRNYSPLITDELRTFYPRVAKFGSGFLLHE